MRRFAKSMLGASWAGTLWGVDQALALARTGYRRQRLATGVASLEQLTSVARGGLGDGADLLFQACDDFQSSWLDALSAELPRDLSPDAWVRGSRALMRRIAKPLVALRPDARGIATRRELINKAEVYVLVRRGSRLAERSRLAPSDVPYALRELQALPPRHRLWAVEGLGHGVCRRALEQSGTVSEPLLADVVGAMPGTAEMLHLGLGMAAAEFCLPSLRSAPNDINAARSLARFAELCRNNAHPGHLDACREALGLVARCFFPELVAVLDRQLEAAGAPDADEERLLFWHGVGRACYFLPLQMMPGGSSIASALARVDREAPSEDARAHARAGVIYAATLVNLADPAVLEGFLSDHGGDLTPADAYAFSNGVRAAVTLGERSFDEDSRTRLTTHRVGARAAELWQHLVRGPLEQKPLERPLEHQWVTASGNVVLASLDGRAPQNPGENVVAQEGAAP